MAWLSYILCMLNMLNNLQYAALNEVDNRENSGIFFVFLWQKWKKKIEIDEYLKILTFNVINVYMYIKLTVDTTDTRTEKIWAWTWQNL